MNRLLRLAVLTAGLIAPWTARAAEACDVAQITNASDLHDRLSRLAVEAVDRAGRNGWRQDKRLAQLISPSAKFSLGAGDVGRPLEHGVAGARALALLMKADTYRFSNWDYIPEPVEACAQRTVEIEFIEAGPRRRAQVKFTFRNGRIDAATGWEGSFTSGPLTPVSP